MGLIIFTIAIAVGLSGGVFLGYWLSKLLTLKLCESSIAPRLVIACSTVGAILFALPALIVSFILGGNIGGGFGALITESIGLGTVGAPVGLTIGIAFILGTGLVVGALGGGLIGTLLTHALPPSADDSNGTAQKRANY